MKRMVLLMSSLEKRREERLLFWTICLITLLVGSSMVFPPIGYPWFTYALVFWGMVLFFLQNVGRMWHFIGAGIVVVTAGVGSGLAFKSWQDFAACAALILVTLGMTWSSYEAHAVRKLLGKSLF